MSKKGKVYPTPQKMYVRNPYSWPIDDIVVRKLPVAESKSVLEERCLEAPSVVSDEMEVEVPVLRNAPHDGSNLMKTENAVQDLPLINEEEEFDLLKEICSKDMEELDKNEGKKRKIKKPTSCPIFGWPFHGRNYRTKPVVDILEHWISKEHVIKDELVSCLRNVERGEKNQRLSATIYRRRTNFGHWNNRASPRGPAVNSKVLIIEGY